MKINKIKMIISTAVIFIPTIIYLIFSKSLSEQIAIHWGLDGNPDGYASPLYVALFLPTILAIIQWLCVYITKKTNENNDQNKKVTEIIYWICPAISLFSNALIISVALGYEINIYSLMCVFFGILFIFIGNYMPKYKQNSTIGVKIKWTLANEENWNATHRFAGKAWFIGGLLYLPLALLPEKVCAVIAVFSMILIAILPTIYSYLYYKKQISRGTLTKEDFATPKLSKKAKLISSVALVLVVLFMFVIMFTGNIKIGHTDSSLIIEATYWENTSISYSDISSIEYSESNAPGERLNGFCSARLMLGWFKSEADGNHTRYTYTSCKSAVIIITKDGKKLIINTPDDEQTKALYEEMLPRLELSEEKE